MVRASSQAVHYLSGTPLGAYPFTMACWVRCTTFASPQMWACLAIGNSGSGGYAGIPILPSGGNGFARSQIDSSRVSAAIIVTPSTMQTGRWHHLCAVFQASSHAIYLDGALGASGGHSESFPTTGRFAAGFDSDSGGSYFDGAIADLAVWSAALSADEVSGMARGVPAGRLRSDRLQLYWPLWGLATTEPDLTGRGRHGTVVGATAADHAPVGR
jgi:Concanavalin A-like lectin/glucanases superfamily